MTMRGRSRNRQPSVEHPGVSVASIHVPELDRDGFPVDAQAIKEVEALLAETFYGFSVRHATGMWREPTGRLLKERVQSYEVAFVESLRDRLIPCVERIASLTRNEMILVTIGDEGLLIGPGQRMSGVPPFAAATAPESPRVYDWPDTFDVGVLAVIGQELKAVQNCFGVDRFKDARPVERIDLLQGIRSAR